MFLDRKKKLFVYKNKIFHSLKNGIFPKGLTHAFGKKNSNFFIIIFFFAKNKTRGKS